MNRLNFNKIELTKMNKISSTRNVMLLITYFGLMLGLPATSLAGNFWQATGSISGNADAFRIAVDSQDRIYVGVQGVGVFVSSDGGTTWANSGVNGSSIMDFAVNSSDHVFAVGNNGVFRTTNNGSSWENISAGLPSSQVRSISINNNGRIFIGFYGQKIYRSDDNGTTWERLENGLSSNTVYESMAINSNGQIFAGTNGACVYRSTDDGDNWQQMCNGLSSAKVWALKIDSEDRIFAGTGNGVCVSTDNGDSWTPVTSTSNEFDINDIAINSADHIFVTNNNGGVWRSTDHGATWENLTDPASGVVSWGLGVNSADYLFCGIGNGQVYRSVETTVPDIAAGQALEFDGNGDYVTTTLNIDQSASSAGVTMEAWVYPTSLAGGRYQVISTDNSGYDWSITRQDGEWRVFSGGYIEVTGFDVDLNTWQHLAAVFIPGTGIKFYKDGQETTITSLSYSDTDAPVSIAANPGFTGERFPGIIDEVRIWDYSRSQAEIQADMYSRVSETATGLSGYWRFDGNVNDLTGNGHDGTINGDPVYIVSTAPITAGGGSAPAAITDSATDINTTFATLNGTVNPNGLSTTVIFEYGTTTSYGNQITADQSPVTGSSDVAVSANLAGLQETTTYHYRVVATNSAGGPITGADQSFATLQPGSSPTVTTNTATNMGTTAATLNGTVNPNGLSTTVIFEYGTTTSYGNQITADQSPVTGSSDVAVSVNLAGLQGNTTYHYRIVATNSAGGPITGADQSFATLQPGSSPTVTTNTATNMGTTAATLNGIVNPNGLSTTVTFEYGETTGYGNQITDVQSPIDGTSNVSVSVNLTGLSENTTYHYRVTASNSIGAVNGEDMQFTTLVDYPSTYTLDNNITFPSHVNPADYSSTDYRMIGLPGDNNALIEALLSGSQGVDWQVYRDNGASADYLVKYSGGSDFVMSKGRGFWLINKGSLTVNTTVPTVPLNASTEAEIPLQSGWNIITNPFTTSVSWATIKSANGIAESIWSYNGNFRRAVILAPYLGYYFFNASGLTGLKIPYSGISAGKELVEPAFPDGWQVNIGLKSGKYREVTTWFGVCENASTEIGIYDFHKPRGLADNPGIYFNRPEWDAEFSSFATDIRPLFDEVETWAFSVNVFPGNPAELSFSGIENIPAQFVAVLFDRSNGQSRELDNQSTYYFTPEAAHQDFVVVVGTREEVSNQLKDIVPKTYSLFQNYPNPFNPQTSILLTIGEDSRVNLIIYNIVGNEVAHLAKNEFRSAGYHNFIWRGHDDNGNKVSSGVYFYHAQALGRDGKVVLNQTRKMILVK